jgi:hypothetical protein
VKAAVAELADAADLKFNMLVFSELQNMSEPCKSMHPAGIALHFSFPFAPFCILKRVEG